MQRLDTNKDGSLSLEEFLTGPMGQRAPERAKERFKALDTNGDGKLSLAELEAGLQRRGPGAPGAAVPGAEPRGERPPGRGSGGESEARPRPNAAEAFRHLDTNADGTLSLEEFLAGPMARRDPERAKARFKDWDKNGDGKLSPDEFKTGFETSRPPGPPAR